MAGSNGTRRVNSGRGHTYRLDGKKVDGVTWAIDNGIPKKALIAWAAREAATFAADHPDLVTALERDAYIDLVKGSPWRDRDKAAKRGTEVHKLAEAISNGQEVQVPDEIVGHVDAYLAFLEDWDPEFVLREAVVGNRKWGYMGTLDTLLRIKDLGFLQVDYKTNRSGPFGEVALQMAAYRYAEFYLDDQGVEQPMPELDGCYCLWLRADGYDFKPVQADERAFRLFLYAQQVAHFTDDWSKGCVGDTVMVGAGR